jgi:hypothetical protein
MACRIGYAVHPALGFKTHRQQQIIPGRKASSACICSYAFAIVLSACKRTINGQPPAPNARAQSDEQAQIMAPSRLQSAEAGSKVLHHNSEDWRYVYPVAQANKCHSAGRLSACSFHKYMREAWCW